MNKARRPYLQLSPPSTAEPTAGPAGHAACIAVEQCQAGGLGQVVASAVPTAKRWLAKGSYVSNDDGLCPSSSYLSLLPAQ